MGHSSCVCLKIAFNISLGTSGQGSGLPLKVLELGFKLLPGLPSPDPLLLSVLLLHQGRQGKETG